MRPSHLILSLIIAGMTLIRPATPAGAHVHVFNESGTPSLDYPFVVSDVVTQHGFYGSISAAKPVDFYRIDLAEFRSFQVWLLVPHSEPCLNFRPSLGFVGVGIGQDGTIAGLPLPEGLTSASVSSPLWGRWVDFDTRLPYFAGPRLFPELEAGTYYLAVYDPSGQAGNYLLLVGDLDTLGGDPNWLERSQTHHACLAGAVS